MSPSSNADASLALEGWLSRPVLGAALVMAAAGFAQFSPTAALADVAEHFGEASEEADAGREVLRASVLGVGLAVMRISSLASLLLSAAADRLGRRPTMLIGAAGGLALAAASALSPGYWWFVAAFALSRPLLVASDTLSEVVAAEHTPARDRAKAIALVSAAYGVGAGTFAVIRGIAGDALGFRGLFALVAVPLVLLPLVARMVAEPERYRIAPHEQPPVLGAVHAGPHRRRLVVLVLLAFATALITGPINTFLFLYGEERAGLTAGVLAGVVVAAAPVGLAGLVVGRLFADGLGRRIGGAAALVGLGVAGVITYSGPSWAVITGYLLTVFAGSAYAAPAGALATELFETDIRASVAGWVVTAGIVGSSIGLVTFGALSTAVGYGWAALTVCVPGAIAAGLVVLLPETRGMEMEESASLT